MNHVSVENETYHISHECFELDEVEKLIFSCFFFYQLFFQDLLAAAKKVAKFLGKSYTDEQYTKLVEHLNFKNLQNNQMVNLTRDKAKVIFKSDSFIRQGKSQAWHSMFSPKLNEQANDWIRENLKDINIDFPFIDIYS